MGQHQILNDYIAGAIGGAAGLIVGHPFDTTKVQLQTRQTSAPFKNSWDAINSIHQSGLAKGFFRGLAFPLASYGIVNSVFFGVYGNALRIIKKHERRKATNREVFLAGCCGGFFQLFVACPVDVVKVVLQSQIKTTAGVLSPGQQQYFNGPLQCFMTLYHTGGIRRCYRGFWIQGMRDLPASGTYFCTYNILHSYMTDNNLTDNHGIFANLMAGGLAGVLSWSLIVPLDVVKSQIQADYTGAVYKSPLASARVVYAKSGIRGFYSGWLMICIRAFPVNAATFLLYVESASLLNGLW